MEMLNVEDALNLIRFKMELLKEGNAAVHLKRFGESEISLYNKKSLIKERDSGRHISRILRVIQNLRGNDHPYEFMNGEKGVKSFFEKGGIITVYNENGLPIAFNASLLLKGENFNVLVFGLSESIPNLGKPDKMEMMGMVYGEFVGLQCLRSRVHLYGACLTTEAPTLRVLDPAFDRCLLPFRGKTANKKEALLMERVKQMAFEKYVEPTFTEANLLEGRFLVESKKEEDGFVESWATLKRTRDTRYDSLFDRYLREPRTDDILFVGDIFTSSLSFLKFMGKLKTLEIQKKIKEAVK